MKRCTTCERTLPLDEFYELARGGRRSDCRSCCIATTTRSYAARAERLRTAEAQIQAAAQLVVSSDGPGVLVVDAGALTVSVNDVQFWRLFEVSGAPGMWGHAESGESGPLFSMLRGIADCYVDRPARKAADHG